MTKKEGSKKNGGKRTAARKGTAKKEPSKKAAGKKIASQKTADKKTAGKKPAARATAEQALRRGVLWVRDSAGGRHRFLRGMVTHDLVQRGLSFEDAYLAARAIRDRIGKREEISTGELRDVIEHELEEIFGAERLRDLSPSAWPSRPDLEVLYHGQLQPFSRGLLARSLQAAGLDLDRAYRLVADLLAALRRERVNRLTSEEVALRMGELLEQHEGAPTAARYRLVRRIHRLPRPLAIYLGGASGTGKSTLALEIAPLLRIYRLTATDTIRQVMRMLLSPRILPALHTSSFEDLPSEDAPGSLVEELPPDERVTETFREQSTRVLVGVRAVVERAIVENMSVVVEGVHLVPPLVPFADLEGAVYQVPLVLTTLSEETHRMRFLLRARQSPRSAERYLAGFPAIRALQQHLIEQAEAHEVPLFDTSDGETSLPRALRLVTGLLEEKLPWLARPESAEERRIVPTLLLALDGVADHPARALGGRTPLGAARKPTLDRLAREGQCGLADPVAPGVVPDTAAGMLALFGQSPLAMKRGPVEALGTGLDLEPGDVAVRYNFATVDAAGHLIDRRAGRIREGAVELVRALDRMEVPGAAEAGIEVRVRSSTEHRLAVVLRGQAISAAIQGSDPGDSAAPGPPLVPRPLDSRDEPAARTARVLAQFEAAAHRLLSRHRVNRKRRAAGLPEANAVISRGAGRVHRLPALLSDGQPLRLACISGDQTVLGIASWLGGEAITSAEMTANLDTDLGLKLEMASKALASHDLVLLHIKGADIAAHDHRPDLKASFIGQLDRSLGKLLKRWQGPLRIAVASDHATSSESGQHAADPVPVLIWGTGITADAVERFDEQSVGRGSLKRFPLQLLLGKLFQVG